MSDDKYSLDDILAEIDRKREKNGSSSSSEYTVTDIIETDEIGAVLRAGKQKKAAASAVGKQQTEQPEPAVNADSREGGIAKQLTEQEENDRRAAQIAEAADRKKRAAEEKAEKKRREEEKAERAHRAQPEKRKAAKQRTDEEVIDRIASDISKAADELRAEKFPSEELAVIKAEMSSPSDASRLFESEEEEEQIKEFSPRPPENDAIIFHTKDDLVTTETKELRKLQSIEEINRALLSVDQNASTPDELLDSLNPMDSRAKAVEELKTSAAEPEMGDTRAVAGNELKNIANGSEEQLKEYPPVTSRKRSGGEKRVDEILFTPRTGAQKPLAAQDEENGSEALVKSLNKKLEENRENGAAADRTVVINDLSQVGKAPSEPLNIDGSKLIDTSIIAPQSEEDKTLEKVRRADELAQKKKSKLASFMLDEIEDEVNSADDEEEEEEDDEEEDEIDLDDENVINDRLNRESRGLVTRLIILGVLFLAALFIAVTNQFNIDLGAVTDLVSKRSHPDYFLYSYLIIGILSFSACSSVVQNGFSRLLRLRPDGDTLCAFSHITAIIALIPYLALQEYIQRGRAHVYLIVSLAALCFNTLSKLCILTSARRNFRFTSGDGAKYFIQHSDDGSADKLAGTTVEGIPSIASMRKTELLCDFIISTYCEDISDRISRIFVPVTLAAALGSGVIAYFMGESSYVWNNVSWASTVASAIFSVGAGFIGSLIVTFPLMGASKKIPAQNAAILGYNAVDEFSGINSALVEAKSLFPANSVRINNIWDYNKHRSSNAPKIAIDEAIIYAASLSVTADSVLADAFFNMLNYKHQLLKQVTDCVYESNLGIMGTIDRRRVLLGNREHMKSHQIIVPDMKKESAANKNDDEVIYLAVNGEVCMLFFVELSANQQVKAAVKKLDRHGIRLIIKTVDGMVTPAIIADLFEIEASHCRIIPFEYHDTFKEMTKYVSKGSAAVSCDGTFTAFSAALCAAKNLKSRINAGCILSIACGALGIILAVIFMLFTNYDMFNCFSILLYNLACMLLTVGIQALWRT